MNAILSRHFCTDKQFYKTALALTLPIALQNIISLGVNMMDTVMLGQLGDLAITAANLGGQLFLILNCLCFGLASGASVLIAQYWGKQDMRRVRQLIALSLRFVAVASGLFTLAGLFAPQAVLRIFSPDSAVIEAGAGYLRVLALSFILYGLSSCYIMCLRGVGQVKVSMVVYGTSFFINVFFNYCFIFGRLGFPALGIPGAAWGTVIARGWECLVVLFYMLRVEKQVGFTPRWLFSGGSGLVGDYIKNSVPVVGNELMFGLGVSCGNMIIGQMSSQFVAAASIANVITQLISVFNWGVSNATGVLIGRTIGAGQRDRAQKAANSLLMVSLGLGLICMTILLAGRGPVLAIYAVSEETRALAWQLLTILALMQPINSLASNLLVGVLRGGGDVRTNFVLDCGLQWVMGLPLAALGAFVWHLDAAAVFLLMRSDYFVKLTLGLLRVRSGRWIRSLTRD